MSITGTIERISVFGNGRFVVDTGLYGGIPAVYIAPADTPGVVGERAQQKPEDLRRLVEGEQVLTFPTMQQAKRVADALIGADKADEIAELRKDKARLDWLESHLIDAAYPFVAIETYPTKSRVVNVTATREEDSAHYTGKTIRAAIDAAMEAK